MTARDITPALKKCKRLILEGKRGKELANCLGVSPRTAYNYVARLRYMGEIVDVTGDNLTTPRIYEDGRREPPFNKEVAQPDGEGQTIEGTPENTDFSKRVVGSSITEDRTGRPNKVVRFHSTGCWDVPIIVLGDHAGRLTDRNGYTIGQWSDMKVSNGSRRQYGTARLYPGEDLRFTLYHAKAGPKLTVTPNDRMVYYKTANIEGPKLLEEQVNSLLDVLTEVHGWKFGQPVYKGVNHYALISPDLAPLLKYADKHTDPDNARVHVDTSIGEPEIEVYDDHDGAIDDVITLYEIPEQLEAMRNSLNEVYTTMAKVDGILRIMASNVGELTKITAELVKTQAVETQIRTFDGIGYQ